MGNSVRPSIQLPKHETQGMRTNRDVEVWEQLTKLIEKHGHDSKHILELWPAYARRIHLGRFLAHWELFKQVIDIPGCIVECGVFRGSSFFTWSKLMETFCPSDRSRKVFGFDSFSGLTDFHKKDGKM